MCPRPFSSPACLPCPALPVLCALLQRDKETREPVRDGPAVLKWEKSLRQMCAKMGSKFVSYKIDGGVWKFEVEHFSRYGLLDLDEDEEEEEGEAAVAARGGVQPAARVLGAGAAGPAAAGARKPQGREAPGVRYGLAAMDSGSADKGEGASFPGL